MEEKYLITIKGTMEQNGERESVELMTRGKFAQRNGAYYIVYAETEATGYAGCTTTVKLSADAREVVMTRFGKAPSQLVIEKGVRHICHYETGFGSVSLGVAAGRDHARARARRRAAAVQLHAGFRRRELHQPQPCRHPCGTAARSAAVLTP